MVAVTGSPVATTVLLLLLLYKDTSPYVFSFVVFFLFSFSIRFRFFPLYHCSSPLFFPPSLPFFFGFSV
jgi:hypothetical protein